ncbi:MAG: hypothetical protein IKN42_03340, partial [Elusimicrobia bacterium]|nr:hypothetical protein [Elusimicrobiota bacterium]
FNDRFGFRKNLIEINIFLKYFINSNFCYFKGKIYYKKGNCFYRNSSFGLNVHYNNPEKYAINLNKLQKYCDNNNIKLYLLVVPRKIEFFDYPIPDKRKHLPDNAETILSYLKQNTKTNIIYPKKEMIEANKETPVYFKTDHHWTKKGAYIGYLELMKQIKNDFPDVYILKEDSLEKYYDNRVSSLWNDNFNIGQTLEQFCIPKFYNKKILDTQYLYYKNPNKDKLQTNVSLAPIPSEGYDECQDNQFYYPDGTDKKVMIIGNSFAGNLCEFLPYSFKYVVKYHDNYRKMNFNIYKGIIETFKPDILILNFQTNYLSKLLKLYKYENNPEVN